MYLFMLAFIFASIFFFILPEISSAETPLSGKIKGFVYDPDLNTPLEYANIILYSNQDTSMVTGTITNKRGYFELRDVRPGQYLLKIDFIGYEYVMLDDIEISRDNLTVDLGDILLRQVALTAEGIEVFGERSPIEFHIDKRVINVSRQQAVISGTAIDVLENVPSVEVEKDRGLSDPGRIP